MSCKTLKLVLISGNKSAVDLTCRLDGNDSFQIIGIATEADMGIETVENLRPDVVLIDIKISGINSLGAIMKIKEKIPEVKIIVLTEQQRDDEVVSVLSAGVNGYCAKNISDDEMKEIIKSVAKGALRIDSGNSKEGFENFTKKTTNPAKNYKDILTKKELAVLELLVKGDSNDEIARKLIISLKTARKCVNGILQKFDVTDRVRAAMIVTKGKPIATNK